MSYKESDLTALWDVIKNIHSVFVDEFSGLLSVDFSIPIDDFTRNYSARIMQNAKTLVIIDIAYALRELSGSDLRFHHLSCAADCGYGKNSALCIHYFKDNTHHAMAIPGINYRYRK